MEKGGGGEEILDSGDTLVGVDGEESWDIPSFREERICGQFVACLFPNLACVGGDVIFGMFLRDVYSVSSGQL